MLELLLLALGLFIAMIPRWAERHWQKRIGELRSGASEKFFEERRSLEAYPPSALRDRLVGGAIALFAIVKILHEHLS
jgi:hypothetical protein